MNHRRLLTRVATVACAALLTASSQAATYYPPAGPWAAREPSALGLDKTRLDAAVAFAVAHENQNNKDLAADIPRQFQNEAPYNALIGPAQTRAAMNGIVIRHGYVAASWGDTTRADMTFSVTKTFVSTVAGLAFDRGAIKSVTDRVTGYMPPGVDLFADPHNAPITWEHLLRQTSDWSGTLYGKPDWADRPPPRQTPEQWKNREMHAPGTFYKYNDTRVNVLALSTMYVMKRPLPEILKANIMDPIGASNTWRWEGYENSDVTVDGVKMKAVPGGGHFGGGMFINAWDMARFGYLFLQNGRWNGKPLISEKWIAMAKSPGPANPGYGYCNWFLNNPSTSSGQAASRAGQAPLPFPSTPRSSVTFQGNGANIVYLDWDHDLVVVARWIDSNRSMDQFLGQVIEAIVK